MNPDHKVGLVIAVLASIVYGLYPPAARAVYADGGNAVFVVIVTTFARALSQVGFCLVRGIPLLPAARDLRWIISGGLFQALSICGIIFSLMFIPGPVTITIIFTYTLMLLFFMAYMGEAKLTLLAVTTAAVSLVGITLVVDLWSSSADVSLIGVLLAFAAAVATTSRMYIFGKQVAVFNPAQVGAWIFSAAALFQLLLLLWDAAVPPASGAGWGFLTLCAVSLSAGTLLMFYGIAKLGAFSYSLVTKLEPIFTAIFSVVLLHEVLQPAQYLGIALVLSGIVAYQVFSTRPGT